MGSRVPRARAPTVVAFAARVARIVGAVVPATRRVAASVPAARNLAAVVPTARKGTATVPAALGAATIAAIVAAPVAVTVLAVTIGSGCSHPPRGRIVGNTFTQGRDERFHFVPPPAPWLPLRASGVDAAWTLPNTGSVMAASTVCRGHRDPPLVVLVNDLLLGTTDRRFLVDEPCTLDDRAARHAVVEARLDGIPLVYDLYVYKKNGCLYDLWLVAPPGAYDQAADAFVGFVTGFRGGGQGSQGR